MFLFYKVQLIPLNAPLRADLRTDPATGTKFRNAITLLRYGAIANRIAFPENRIALKVKVFNLCVLDTENSANLSRIAGINIGKIRLFSKDNIHPLFMLCVSHKL
jgi:hypothetical protein